jgi:hypothetical protein
VNNKTSVFYYLDASDLREFEENSRPEARGLIVADGKTIHRVEKYIPEYEFLRIRFILTALVKDFGLPSIRYTEAVALTMYSMVIEGDADGSVEAKHIVNTELSLLVQHLVDDDNQDEENERELYETTLELVAKRWREYVSSPSEFVF